MICNDKMGCMAQYHDVADRLRTRIQSGEFGLGDKLPSISEIQDRYGIRSLNTVRAAQQLLAEEGLIETRQGVGAFVIGTESLKALDVQAELVAARDRLGVVLAALQSQTHHKVTFDLNDPADPHLYFVLTTALSEFASRLRWEAEDPDESNTESRREWAEAAEAALRKIEAV